MSHAQQRAEPPEHGRFGAWLQQGGVGPFEYLDATMDGGGGFDDSGELPIDAVMHWLRIEMKLACLSMHTVRWNGTKGTAPDRLFLKKWYLIECSGNCRGLRYAALGFRPYMRVFHYGTSKEYPVVHMLGDLSYQDFTWQFTRSAQGQSPRIRVFAFGSESDHGPGCKEFDQGEPPAVSSPTPSAAPPQRPSDPTPSKIKHVEPVYPPVAAAARVEGTVTLQISVGTDGRVQQTAILRSIPLLDAAATAAVRQWVYDARGLRAPVTMTVTVPFSLPHVRK